MTFDEIKAAVERGDTVHWSNEGYTVVKDKIGQWLIIWNRGGYGESCTGLTWADDTTVNGQPEEFFTGTRDTAARVG